MRADADERRSIASTTKLMTALLTLEHAKLSDIFTAADYFPAPAESQIGLQPGERMTVRDLMRGLLVESANDAAVTLAEGVSGSKRAFVRAMNRRAQQLKLTNTHYANPIGLDESGNYSSARDLVHLAVVLRTNRFFRTTTDRPAVRLTTGNRTRTFANRNTLVRSTAGSTASRAATRARRATCWSARAAGTTSARLRRARHVERRGPRRRHAGAAAVRLPALPGDHRDAAGRRDDPRADPLPPWRRAGAGRRAHRAPHRAARSAR